VVFSIDILINFNTGFYEKGILIMDRVKILKNYLSFWFWVDIVSTIPIDKILGFDSSNNNQAGKVLKFVRVLRVLKLLKLIRLTKLKFMIIKIKDRISNKTILSFITVGKLLLYLFLIAHSFACTMYSVSSENLEPESFLYGIINKSGKEIISKTELYISCLYWALVTMASVGYGDFSPKSSTERIFGIITMIFSSITFGFILGNISTVVEKHSEKENARREILTKLNYLMKKHKFNLDLRSKTRKYVEYMFSHEKNDNLKTADLLSLLSESLQREILMHTNGSLIKSKSIFSNFDENFVNRLTRTLQTRIYSPLDLLIREGELSKGMFFITAGIVVVFDETSRCRLQSLSDGNIVGEIGLFMKKKCVSTVSAADFVETFFLEYADFYGFVENNAKWKEIVDEMRNSCKDGNYSALYVECYICRKLGHIAKDCQELKNDEVTKKTWYAGRMMPRRIPRISESLMRMPRNVTRRYSKVNVLGKPRHPREAFPHYSRLVNSIYNFFSNTRKGSNSSEPLFNHTIESHMNSSFIYEFEHVDKILSESDEVNPMIDVIRDEKFDMNLIK
jgi:hyperpolarization activated cyclic nucleotide-gated potassium channel 2